MLMDTNNKLSTEVKSKKTKWSFVTEYRWLSLSAAATFVLIFAAFGIRLLVGTHAAPALIGDDSKSNCIYVGDGTNGATMKALTDAQQLTGMTFNCLETTNANMPGWASWESPSFTKAQYGFTQWVAGSPSTRQLVIAQDLIPSSLQNLSNPLSWERSCDAGLYNTFATTFAQNLVAAGFGNSVIRLGYEMNGLGEPDSMGTTNQEMSAWAQCYAHEVTAMRAVAGAQFLFDWNPNSCYINEPFSQYYPGDSYVDIIGLDQYDAFCTANPPKAASDATFSQLEAEPGGLNAIETFAKQHGKPMSLPQWGDSVAVSGGFGDDPYYTSGIGAFVRNHDVAFQSYFDEGDNGILKLSSSYPLSLAAYKTDFASPQ